MLRDTDDGFVIADEDFRLRGGGDVLGTKQSGLPGFRLADPIAHEALLHMANRDAAVLLGKDPKLTTERGRAIRTLLRLFEKAAAMRTRPPGSFEVFAPSVDIGGGIAGFVLFLRSL